MQPKSERISNDVEFAKCCSAMKISSVAMHLLCIGDEVFGRL